MWIFRIKATEANYCKNIQRKITFLCMCVYMCIYIYICIHTCIYEPVGDTYPEIVWCLEGYFLHCEQWHTRPHGSAVKSWIWTPFGMDRKRKTNTHKSPASLHSCLGLQAKNWYSPSSICPQWISAYYHYPVLKYVCSSPSYLVVIALMLQFCFLWLL